MAVVPHLRSICVWDTIKTNNTKPANLLDLVSLLNNERGIINL
jgi:hypothetical protein